MFISTATTVWITWGNLAVVSAVPAVSEQDQKTTHACIVHVLIACCDVAM